jgi:hypothetical protein
MTDEAAALVDHSANLVTGARADRRPSELLAVNTQNYADSSGGFGINVDGLRPGRTHLRFFSCPPELRPNDIARRVWGVRK